MAFRVDKRISFDSPPTLDEAIRALEALRETAGGDALLRVRAGRSALNRDGPYPSRFAAEPPPQDPDGWKG